MPMRRLLQQPLLWFLLIGVLLFAADELLSVDRVDIYAGPDLQRRLGNLWQTQTGQPAKAQELESLVNNWIEEEVLYREALRLGLDEEDTIIRRRLIQKIKFIAEAEPIATPGTTVLQLFYEQHIEDYTLPKRYSFRQLYFQTLDAANAALLQIEQGAIAERFGETSMLGTSYAYRSGLELNAAFGLGFADRIDGFDANVWRGPVISGFGYHLIEIVAFHSPEQTPFTAAAAQVAMDYRQVQQETARQSYIEQLMSRYSIIREAR